MNPEVDRMDNYTTTHNSDGGIQIEAKYNYQKGKLKTEMEKEYRKAMYHWAK